MKARRGAISELIASAWLLERGYEVFRNVSASGIGDLVAYHLETKVFRLVDVKSENENNYHARSKLTEKQSAHGVIAIYVRRDGTCEWVDAPEIKGAAITLLCACCYKPFVAYRSAKWAKYCSPECRRLSYNSKQQRRRANG